MGQAIISCIWRSITILSFIILCSCHDETRLVNNLKASYAENDSLTSINRLYAIKISEMNYLSDSISKALNEARNALKIKDRKLRALQYIQSKASKVDTVVFRDTIFMEDVKIDTTITDGRWYSNRVQLEYPDKIVVEPTFWSEKIVVMSTKKETVKPPSKVFFIRWFQKRHTVVEVNIQDKNPYIVEEKNKFIEIVK